MTQTLTTTDELKHLASSENTNELTRSLARECLANREAQPVAFLSKGDVDTNQSHILARRYQSLACTMPVYTSPPAPAVIILDKVSCEGFDPKDWVEARNLGQCEGWNACRAAMLAQPVSQGCKLNSPEIPDGCHWTFDEHDSTWDSGCGEAWMFSDGGPTENGVKFCQSCGKPVLLAAAPEGGNG